MHFAFTSTSAIKVLLLLCSYFLDNAERICNTNYVPTVKDILHARLKTTGASELNFEVKQHKFHVIDVGGQRCQRTQWYVNSLVPRSLIPSSFIPSYLIPICLIPSSLIPSSLIPSSSLVP